MGSRQTNNMKNDFSLQEKVASERFLVSRAEEQLKEELVIFKFKFFVFLRCEKDLRLLVNSDTNTKGHVVSGLGPNQGKEVKFHTGVEMKQREEENHGNKIKVRVGVQRLKVGAKVKI